MKPPRRSGLLTLEALASMTLLGTLLALAVPMLVGMHKQQRSLEWADAARRAAANLAEELALEPWENLTAAALKNRAPPEELATRLPDAALAVTVFDEPGPPAARRIRIELHWTDGLPRSVGLTRWYYPQP